MEYSFFPSSLNKKKKQIDPFYLLKSFNEILEDAFFFLFPFSALYVNEINSLAFTFYFSYFFSFLHPNQIKTNKKIHMHEASFFLYTRYIYIYIYKKGRTGGCRKTFPLLLVLKSSSHICFIYFSFGYKLKYSETYKPYYFCCVYNTISIQTKS